MKKRLFLFVTPDGVTYSSSSEIYPDVDNFQVLGYGKEILKKMRLRISLNKTSGFWVQNLKK